jgi:hypothetical protein
MKNNNFMKRGRRNVVFGPIYRLYTLNTAKPGRGAKKDTL